MTQPRDDEWYAVTMSQALESAYEAAEDLEWAEPTDILLAWIGAQLRDMLLGEGEEPWQK